MKEKRKGHPTVIAYVDWCKNRGINPSHIESILEYSQIGLA